MSGWGIVVVLGGVLPEICVPPGEPLVEAAEPDVVTPVGVGSGVPRLGVAGFTGSVGGVRARSAATR